MSRPAVSPLTPKPCCARLIPLCFALVVCVYVLALRPAMASPAAGSPRERVSLNSDWRFQKGDPPGTEDRLAYEKIKNWIRATGGEFALSSDAPKPNRP